MTPEQYLAAVAEPRRAQLEKLRALVKKAVPAAEEGMAWGMLGYQIGGRPFAALAAHKSRLSLYLMDLYTQPALREQHAAALAGLKMGKSCINFESVDELPLAAIAAILKAAPKVEVKSGTLAATAKKRAGPKAKKP